MDGWVPKAANSVGGCDGEGWLFLATKKTRNSIYKSVKIANRYRSISIRGGRGKRVGGVLAMQTIL
jgi:hypothetical protein